MKKLKLYSCWIIALFLSYSFLKIYRLGTQKWKYSDDNPILGDITELDISIVGLFTNKIYRNNTAVAYLIDYQYRFIDDVIIIETLDGKYKGRYCSK
jgi:hypothetical protein